MKKLIIFLAFGTGFYSLLSCKQKQSSDKTSNPNYVDGGSTLNNIPHEDTLRWTEIQWLDTLKDLGTLKKGGLVELNFRFKNIGKKPLSINSVVAGCGCTQPEKPAKLIQPGESDIVKAKFNTENQKEGPVQKNITVVCNTRQPTYELKFNANIIANN